MNPSALETIEVEKAAQSWPENTISLEIVEQTRELPEKSLEVEKRMQADPSLSNGALLQDGDQEYRNRKVASKSPSDLDLESLAAENAKSQERERICLIASRVVQEPDAWKLFDFVEKGSQQNGSHKEIAEMVKEQESREEAQKTGVDQKAEKKSSKRKESDDTDDNEPRSKKSYEVDEVVDHKHYPNGNMKFLLKWKGYGDDDNSWEPEENMSSCSKKIAEYWARRLVDEDNFTKETSQKKHRTAINTLSPYRLQKGEKPKKVSGMKLTKEGLMLEIGFGKLKGGSLTWESTPFNVACKWQPAKDLLFNFLIDAAKKQLSTERVSTA